MLGPGVPENVVALSLETMEILRKAGADINARITDTTSLTARIARASTLRVVRVRPRSSTPPKADERT